MLLKEIFEDFNVKYSNNPIQFEDIVSSDGVKNSFELSYSPLCDYDPYGPQVILKEKEGEKVLLAGSDYVIDHEAGVIRFLVIPKAGEENVSVRAFYQRCNLKQFINHYNMAVRMMQTTFPVEKIFKIEGPENENVKAIRLTDPKFSQIYKVLEVFQNEDDVSAVPTLERDSLIVINPNKVLGPDYRSPGDYNVFSDPAKPGIKYPYYISAHMKYEEFETNKNSLMKNVQFDHNARNQIILLIARYMYEAWIHRAWSLTSTVLDIQEQNQLRFIIQSIDLQLYGDLRANFTAKTFPSTYKKEA